MFNYIKTSKRNVKSHREYNKQIPKGTKYIRISNGTIGPGARHINIPLEILLQGFTLEEITQAYWLAKQEKTRSIDYQYESWPEPSLNIMADDIPF
jgi:hypothetical protein